MDSAELLDLLGNANRRRILRLLARKPCYVTEIGEYLGVSPKAVIDHLRKLEEAGMVESRVDDQRRKYFSISRNLRLEVTVSPYEFGAKSAYPASCRFDVTTCEYLTIDVEPDDGADVADMAETLRRLEALENELSLAQRWVQGRLTEVREDLAAAVDDGDPALAAAVLRHVADGGAHVEEIGHAVDAPPPVVQDVLEHLASRGIVHQRDGIWHLRD